MNFKVEGINPIFELSEFIKLKFMDKFSKSVDWNVCRVLFFRKYGVF